MAANGQDKSDDFYAVLGLDKECTPAELRNAYKKLAMRWHPDRYSASGNSKFVEEAKKKFQAIQRAYSVLSDSNKRFLYDVGAYDSDEDENGMGDFLNEMAVMMSQTKPSENGDESFEQLQELFVDMFQKDLDGFAPSSQCSTSSVTSSSFVSFGESSSSGKRGTSQMNYVGTCWDHSTSCDAHFRSFALGVEHKELKKGRGTTRGGVPAGSSSSRSRHGRKQRVSSGHDHVSSNDRHFCLHDRTN